MAVEKGREEMVMVRRASQINALSGFQKVFNPQIPIIVPTSKRKRRWDIVIMLLVIFTASILPYQAAFGGGETMAARATNWTTDVFFVLDIVFNFRTAFIDGQGRLITKTGAISQRYMKSWFFIDFVSILPFEILGSGHQQLFKLLKCTRLLRLAKVAKFLDFVKFLEKSEYANMYRIFKLFATFMLMVHLTACFFWIIIDGQKTGDDAQVKWNSRFEDSSRFSQYSVSVYYSLLMLVGENIGPNTTTEMVVVSICMIVGAIFYANLFGQVSLLVTNFNRTSSRFKEKLDIVNENMRTLQLPDELRVRVNHYYEYKWNRNRCLDHGLFLRGLSKALASEVSLHCYRELIAECPMFKDAGGDCIVALVNRLTTRFYLPGDYVIKKGEIGKEMFFVSRGSCEAVEKGRGQPDLVFEEGKYFGEICLLKENRRTKTIRAKQYLDLCILTKACFDVVLEEHTESAIKILRAMELKVAEYSKADNSWKKLRKSIYLNASDQIKESSRALAIEMASAEHSGEYIYIYIYIYIYVCN